MHQVCNVHLATAEADARKIVEKTPSAEARYYTFMKRIIRVQCLYTALVYTHYILYTYFSRRIPK